MSNLPISPEAQRAEAMQRSIERQLRESLDADSERDKAKAEAETERRRNPLPSDDHSRYGHAGGAASYARPANHPPIELIRAVPELDELFEAWQAENDKGRQLAAEHRAAELARTALFDGRDGDGNVRRRDGVSMNDVDAAELRVREAAVPVRQQEARALEALKAFDDAAHEPELRPIRQRIMAPVALAAHERLKAAWTELQEAAEIRATAYSKAGSPGREWERRVYGPLTAARQTAEGFYSAMIEGFDVKALEAIAGKDNA